MNRELLETPYPPDHLYQRQSNFGHVPDDVEALAAIQRLNDALDIAGRFETLEHHEPTEFDEVLELGRHVSRLAQERILSIHCPEAGPGTGPSY